MKESLQPDKSDEVAMPAQMPECVGMLTVDKLKTLLEAFGAARKAGIHATTEPPVQDPATEIMGLLSSQKAQQKHISAQSKKIHNSNMLITPPHIRSALHKWYMASTESFSNPLKFDGTFNTYFSTSNPDQ
eukprot:501244-Pelagomonas_calceolata.AAC.1